MATANHTKTKPPVRGFTTKWLENLKKPSKDYEDIPDKGCAGLYLRSYKTGHKSFRWNYIEHNTGKTKAMTFGSFPDMSLEKARKAQKKAKALHQEGESPARPEDTPQTVEELSVPFYKIRIKPHRARPDVVKAILDNDILPEIGKRKLATISTPAVAACVNKVVARGAVTHAGKVLAILKQMFRFAEGNGYIDHSPAYSLEPVNLGVEDNIRERNLSAEDVKAFYAALDAAPRLSVQIRAGLKILLMTGARTSELLKARWEHFTDDEWLIPAENVKQKLKYKKMASRSFTVPISHPYKDRP